MQTEHGSELFQHTQVRIPCHPASLISLVITPASAAERALLQPDNDVSSPLSSEVTPTCARRDLDRTEDTERV
ncbi:hypothetical protein GCM10010317_103160 [Streptomyces mirabilis]|nr:hypothetical protein GCM10010317_103160 [Streptomyces mirabilis]